MTREGDVRDFSDVAGDAPALRSTRRAPVRRAPAPDLPDAGDAGRGYRACAPCSGWGARVARRPDRPPETHACDACAGYGIRLVEDGRFRRFAG